MVKSTNRQVLSFFSITRADHLLGIRGAVCILISLRILWVTYFRTDSGSCIHHLFLLFLLLDNFLHQPQLMVFLSSLSESKSPHVSRTLFNILADLNNAVVWMVTFSPLISKSSSPFINHSMTVPRASITISIDVTFMFHSFFNSLAKSRYFFSIFF